MDRKELYGNELKGPATASSTIWCLRKLAEAATPRAHLTVSESTT